MTELEKALRGESFNNMDEEVMAYQVKVKDLCHRYNALAPSDEQRRQVLWELLGGEFPHVFIEPGFRCVFGRNIHFKGLAMVNFNCTFLDMMSVTIGANAMIGPGCTFVTASHAIDPTERMMGLFDNKPITVGDNVWLGANVTVLPGVSIGDGAVVGAGSVVTKDIPAGVIAVGSPCKVLRPISERDKLRK